MAVRERMIYAVELATDGAKAGLVGLKTAINEAEGATGKLKAGWASAMDSFKASQGAQIAAAGVAVGVIAKSVEASSALEESTNAVTVAYGKQAAEVLKLGETSATSVGMSQRAFNELAVQFSSFAKNISTSTGQPVALVLDDLTKRVADFASVMNLDANEAAQVFMSTLSGETEPIRRFGKDVSAAAVELYALENGLISNKSELTESIKVQARYGLLMQQTADVTGDFANTSESLANQQRILKAQVEDLAASFGSKLIPVVSDSARIVTNLMSTYDKLKSAAGGEKGGGGFFGTITDAANTAINPVKQYGEVTRGLAEATDFLNEKFGDTPAALTASSAQADRYTESLTGMAEANNQAILAENEAAEARIKETNQAEAYVDLLESRAIPVLEAEAAAALKARDAAKKLTDQYNSQKNAAQSLLSAKVALVGGELAVRDAQREARDAAEELDDALDGLTEGTDEYQGALDNATQAQLDAAQSAADYRAEQMEANGTTVDAKVKARLMAEELYALAGTLNGPLQAAVLNYIAQLRNIPTSIGTVITVSGGGKVATGGLQPIGGGIKLAEGGIVKASPGGTLATIGEGGRDEAVIPLQNGAVPVQGGGSVVFSGDIHLHGVQSPEQLVEQLGVYARRNGGGTLRKLLGLPPV